MNWGFASKHSMQTGALAAVEQLLNQAISYDPAAQSGIASLAGKVLAIESTLPRIIFYISHSDQGLGLHNDYDGEPDTWLMGSGIAIASLAVGAKTRTTFAGSGVEVTGDQELLSDIQSILANLDVDWETALAQLIGDVPAHFLSKSLKATFEWGEMAKTRAANVATGFVQEEAQLVPSAIEVEQWSADIQQLRTDTDRLEANIKHLQDKLTIKLTDGPTETSRVERQEQHS